MSNDPDGMVGSEETVGEALARLRRARGLTGAMLAAKVGMSQPKISRLERGIGVPDPKDVKLVARALGADDRHVRTLVERAERAHDRMTDWRPARSGLAGQREGIASLEAAAAVVREFQPAVLPDLLQTTGYARSLLAATQRLARRKTEAPPDSAVLAAASARLGRQEILAEADKSFRFVISEAVLWTRICSSAEMLAQINHLRIVSTWRENVVLSIIPGDVQVDYPTLHGFTLLDDNLIIINAYNTSLISRGRADMDQYRRIFSMYEECATTDVEPLLTKYEMQYIERLGRPDANPQRPRSRAPRGARGE